MGIFDFALGAGPKVLGKVFSRDDDKETEAQSSDASDDSSNAAASEGEDKAASLKAYVTDLGLSVEGLKVTFKDGVVSVSGKVKDQATKEKVVLALGNVEGVKTVDEKLEVVESQTESTMRKVVAGDTLSQIAAEVYGDASKYPVIFEANKPMLKDPDLIYPGQVLRIPALADA